MSNSPQSQPPKTWLWGNPLLTEVIRLDLLEVFGQQLRSEFRI